MALMIKSNLGEGLKKFDGVSAKAMDEALLKSGIQLINWMVSGSPYSSRVPPIYDGILRGSGSVFLGKKLIKITGSAAATLYDGARNTLTIGFNTSYATKMHEENWRPGPISRQSGADVGNKWIAIHLQTDGKAWLAYVAKIMDKKL